MNMKSMVVGALAVGVTGAAIFSFSGGPPLLSMDGAMVGAKVVAAAVVGGYVASYVGGSWNY